MSGSLSKICDPESGTLSDAIEQAKSYSPASGGFEFDLSRFLQMECYSSELRRPLVFRGLEVLEAITDESRLLTVFRPFLRSTDPQIASKCVLLLGRRCVDVGWMKHVMAELDDRVRANLIESLWRRSEPEIVLVLESALKDAHHRVAANATYGLFLIGSDTYIEGLDFLISSANPLCRRSAIWVIRSTATAEATARIKPLIRDSDADVRHAAFEALVALRQNPAAKAVAA